MSVLIFEGNFFGAQFVEFSAEILRDPGGGEFVTQSFYFGFEGGNFFARLESGENIFEKIFNVVEREHERASLRKKNLGSGESPLPILFGEIFQFIQGGRSIKPLPSRWRFLGS